MYKANIYDHSGIRGARIAIGTRKFYVVFLFSGNIVKVGSKKSRLVLSLTIE